MALNKNLKLARAMADLTQEEAAERVGVSRQTMSNWENGKTSPDIVSIMNLSKIYNVAVELLLSPSGEMVRYLKGNMGRVQAADKDAVNL